MQDVQAVNGMKCNGLPPIINSQSKILVLGTMPSRESIERKQYYANPRNHFWPIIFSILGKTMQSKYSEKIACLLKCGIALWDVLASCDRLGSGDKNIRNVVVNDFSSFFEQYTSLKMVVFNGSKAEKLWKEHVKLDQSVDFMRLPSTSPALARPIDEKLLDWSIIKNYL